MTKTHRSIFLKEVKEKFPEIRKAINSEGGLLHCEVGVFLDYVMQLIRKHDKERVIDAFKIIERHYHLGNRELANAIAISFLEDLDLGLSKGNVSWAYEYLPKSLIKDYESLRKYHGY